MKPRAVTVTIKICLSDKIQIITMDEVTFREYWDTRPLLKVTAKKDKIGIIETMPTDWGEIKIIGRRIDDRAYSKVWWRRWLEKLIDFRRG